MDKRRISGCGIAFIVALVIVGTYLGIRSYNRSAQLRPFGNYVNEYLNIPELKEWDGDAYIVGKVITIDTEEQKIDPMYFEVPEELRATEPEQVGTIVWLKWEEHEVGRYTDGANAYRYTCDVTIIDKSNAVIVASDVFTGSDPPSSKTGSGSRSGSKPTKDIIEYIETLPRK